MFHESYQLERDASASARDRKTRLRCCNLRGKFCKSASHGGFSFYLPFGHVWPPCPQEPPPSFSKEVSAVLISEGATGDEEYDKKLEVSDAKVPEVRAESLANPPARALRRSPNLLLLWKYKAQSAMVLIPDLAQPRKTKQKQVLKGV